MDEKIKEIILMQLQLLQEVCNRDMMTRDQAVSVSVKLAEGIRTAMEYKTMSFYIPPMRIEE